MILFLSATMPPHIGGPANPSSTPAVILPDWYLYWSFGLLKLGPLNPEIASSATQMLMATAPTVCWQTSWSSASSRSSASAQGVARRPVEQPFWAAVGMSGVVFALPSLLAIKNLMPMNVDLLFDLTFLLPFVFGTITYAVLKTMREGYMYNLNRRYYRLRPPK
ncbi:hypothetical protein C9J85_03720 [Haloferax sp. wsp5]|nr:hypothetical protein C9J85_03720 [Haloferax sp. wsp5]